MTIDQDRLDAILTDARAKAEAATSRVWHAWDRSIGWEVHVGAEHIERDWEAGIFCTDLNSGFRETFAAEDAEYIARMDPATALLLLDAVDTLRAENERLRGAGEVLGEHGFKMIERAEAAEAVATDAIAAVDRLQAEAADLRTRLANVRALAEDLFARAPDQRTDQWHARLEVARDILRALDGPQDGTPAEQQVADLAGLTVADVRDVGGLPQDGGEGR